MKKNNKGFMLVEVIIVTVVVATIMISLYVAFNKVYTAYEEKNNYTNIDGIYALKLIKDDYINSLKLNSEIKKANDEKYVEISSSGASSYIASVFDEYKINKVYLVKTNQIGSLKSLELNQTFKEYIEYFIKKHLNENNEYVKIDDKGKEITVSHILLIEIKIDEQNEVYNYAYLEI